MEIILLERVENLGQMGDVVKVRDGYARNFLLPRKKALRANEENRKLFEQQRAELEARNLEQRKEAEAVAGKIDGRSFVMIRQASEMGHLYGSVSTRDIAEIASADGLMIDRTQVRLDKPLKTLGIFSVRIALHPEVTAKIEINVARSAEEAERQARGENILAREEEPPEKTEAQSAEFFDETAQAAAEATGGASETSSQ
ncbi:MAG: 50S ribosomal protein L9 [Alphaproteobacteria bacterium]|nr:50S ribosomal protein L9 [Alphaproteobacteria bacterium]